ncbi:Uncharacterised protein [Vibrio cholerae]|uniref:Uncharacterized protein n=1 Tax=Vibrio cholerae TaxID=666 RepID=A0A655VKF5_VIBCL|nr:Uncharacterised protein [Vibrio cholerae]
MQGEPFAKSGFHKSIQTNHSFTVLITLDRIGGFKISGTQRHKKRF